MPKCLEAKQQEHHSDNHKATGVKNSCDKVPHNFEEENLADKDDIEPVILGVCRVTEVPNLHTPHVNSVFSNYLGRTFVYIKRRSMK